MGPKHRTVSARVILATCYQLLITNPKRGAAAQTGRDRWFPYYAGFSSEFANQLIASSSLAKGSALMDPWNGSGTTTSFAALNGYRAVGFDLNPVMAVVAKARLLPQCEIVSVAPLLADILTIRRIELAIYKLLVSAERGGGALDSVGELSSLAAFFYVALFRAVRSLLHRFKGSNPTWITRPRSLACRIRPAVSIISERFSDYATRMALTTLATPAREESRTIGSIIRVASSEKLPVFPGTIDFVLSSPPYCTRIDYGVATLPELAVMGFEVDKRLGEFRAGLIGTPTIHPDTPEPSTSWGNTCVKLLKRIHDHRSKAASAYYYKTYIQYFAAMAQSFSELSRCLKLRATCVLVVQDSYFKDLHIDLAVVFAEMARSASLELCRQVDFPISRTFGSINSSSRSYRDIASATESVLCFTKAA
jgi:hypothetical protein